MKTLLRLVRLLQIAQILVKYGLEQLLLDRSNFSWIKPIFFIFPERWKGSELRIQPRGARIRLALEELGPIFVKFGQILSTRRDLIPDDIGLELEKLQDRLPPFSGDIAIETIERTLKSPINSIFSEFEKDALASASIAQIHRATLHSGELVVVKVLRPGIKKRISKDVLFLELVAKLVRVLGGKDGARLRPEEVVSEFEKTVYDELDMQREAASASALRRNFENSDILYVPQVYWDYTRQAVLVIERIDGVPIRETKYLKSVGTDMKKLAERGVDIFFTQVFRDNFFHADMHPGNIFINVENPADPKYIAVDFGIVGSLTESDRSYLAENFLAFFKRDYRRVAQLHIDSGWVPRNTRVEDFESSIRTVCEPIFEKPLEEISFGQVLLRLFQTAQRFNMEIQPQLVLLQKTLLNIEGMGRDIYPKLDLWQTASPYLENWVKDQRGPKAAFNKVLKNFPVWLQHSPDLPMLFHDYFQKQIQINDLHYIDRDKHKEENRKLRRLIVGCMLFFTATVCGSIIYSQGQEFGADFIPFILMGAIGLYTLVTPLDKV